MTADEMTVKQAEEHLKGGGKFIATGGALLAMYVPEAGRYIIRNETGNGGDYIQDRVPPLLDLMDQLAGLGSWELTE